ncbi:MAG: winged helix-turn-helix domain-containing protein, partial [Candidatus Aenigmarchaeota archaeon]|nr:winged helix-turn-helix domain-containing protein [Candidatus Aenigmarchaeota archaeon]
KTPQKTPQKILTGLERKILDEIAKNSYVSMREIAILLDISADTVKEYMKRLKEKKIIERVGPDKGGCWKTIHGKTQDA